MRLAGSIPGAPPFDAPVPTDAVEGVSLEQYAQIAGAIAAKQPRAPIFAERGLDERRWMNVEKTWLLRLAVAALREELEIVARHDRAFAEGRDGAVR